MNFLELPTDRREGFLAQVRDDDARKLQTQKRVDIATDDFTSLIEDAIDDLYVHPTVKKGIKKWANYTSYINPLKQITENLAVAYMRPPTRTLRDVGEPVRAQFQQLLDEGRLTLESKQWLRWALICNLVVVIPRVVGDVQKRVMWEMHTPNTSEVIVSRFDHKSIDVFGYRLPTPDGTHVVVVDDTSFKTYDPDDKLVDDQPHDLGIFPGVVFRVTPPERDFWSSMKGNDLIQATTQIGVINAVMSYVRASQNRKVSVISGEKIHEQIAPGQTLEPGIPLIANTDAGGNFNFDVLDVSMPIDEFATHIRFIFERAAEQNGLPSYFLDMPNSPTTEAFNAVAAAKAGDRLKKLRDDQIEYLRLVERDLMWKTALMAKLSGHPLAVDPMVVKDNYDVQFPPFYDVDSPAAKLQYSKQLIELNAGYSQVDVVMERIPGLSRERALELIERGLEERKIVADFHAKYNLPADANLGTLAQINGAMGGAASSTANPPPDSSADGQ